MAALITLNHISKVYRPKDSKIQTKALDDISLSIEQGDFVAIAGPSGSGKTTLLNIIGGLDTASSGTVLVDEINLTSLNRAALAEFRLKKVGFVFQSYNLIETLTALENAEYVPLLQRIPAQQRKDKSTALLAELGLEGFLNRRPAELSAGQQQRVAVARAMASGPALVLADEPTANLDSATGAELINLMRALNQKKGITFLFATHDKMVIEKANRVIWLHDGRITSA